MLSSLFIVHFIVFPLFSISYHFIYVVFYLFSFAIVRFKNFPIVPAHVVQWPENENAVFREDVSLFPVVFGFLLFKIQKNKGQWIAKHLKFCYTIRTIGGVKTSNFEFLTWKHNPQFLTFRLKNSLLQIFCLKKLLILNFQPEKINNFELPIQKNLEVGMCA